MLLRTYTFFAFLQLKWTIRVSHWT